MSTRALYAFIDHNDVYHVYKHCDGYPSGAIQWIEQSLSLAWTLPRFEADEFAAAFISANKDREGGVYVSKGNNGGLDYRYEIRRNRNTPTELEITIFKFTYNKEGEIDRLYDNYKGERQTQIFKGNLQEMKIAIAKEEI
jgi:hypothetical protein